MSIHTSRLGRFLLRSLSLFAIPATLLPAAGTAQSVAPRVTLATRSAQALATATDAGLVPSSQQVSVTLTLAATDARKAALDTFLTALTTPSSASYHHWITPAQFATTYGATADQLAAISAWAQAQGLSVVATSPAGTRVTVSGSASKVQSAFATSLHLYQSNGAMYFANVTQPSLPGDTAALISAIDGLDNLPASSAISTAHANAKGTTVVSPVDFATLSGLVDTNATPILSLTTTAGTSTISASQLAEYALLFRQAAAQGITVIAGTSNGNFPGVLPEVTAVALPGDAAPTDAAIASRPNWQAAPGLPADGLRDAPDLTASSLAVFTQTITGIAAGGRLGNINPTLYLLGPTPGLYTQPDAAAAGTWETATGLGLVDPAQLAKSFPSGSGSSFTSFSATNYSPTHGQGTSFTSNVTSGTGGATPTGTVAFVTSAGVVLGTVPLVGGSATLAINTLDGGNYVLSAQYSGDATYAPSQSPTSQIYVAPEPVTLTAVTTGSPTVGGTFTVTVTDSATYGQPTGPITLQISGTSSVYTATLAGSTPTSSTASFNVPSPGAGTITLSITCTTSLNYSCYNPLTTTVTISKATPVLSISYTPNPPVSGQSIALNAVVSTVGTAPAPTGSVTFFDNGTTLNASQLSNGTTSTTGTVPTSSTHNITGTYAGDSNYNSVTTTAGSTSSGTITTTTVLTASVSTFAPSQAVTFTATIVPASTGPAVPSGTVQFFDNGASIGTANVSGNIATFTTSALSSTVLTHSITAVYSGDGYYSTSTSAPVTLTASAASSTATIALTASSLNPIHGTNETFTATVTAPTGGATATGTVTFTSTQGGSLGSATLVNGVASVTTKLLPGGVTTVLAAYSGSTTYNAVTSSQVNVTVTPEPVTLTITPPSNAVFGSVFTVNVTASGTSGVGSPTGVITIQPSGSGYSTATAANLSPGTPSTSTATVSVQANGAGNIIVSATYNGDANFSSAGPTPATVSVAQVTSATSLGFTPNPIVSGQPVTLKAKLTSAGTILPTGTIQFFDGSSSLGTVTVASNAAANLTVTLSAGNHTLYAVYSGDANYQGSTSPSTNTSTGTTATTTALTVSPSTVTAGNTLTFTAVVGPTVNGTAPTGTVQFVSAGSVLCSATLAASTASCTTNPSVTGAFAVTANYLGDSNYAPSSSTAGTYTVTAVAGTLSATITPGTATPGSSATVTALITVPTSIVPTGSITATVSTTAGAVLATYTGFIPPSRGVSMQSIAIPVVVPATAGAYTVTVACLNTNFTCAPVTLGLISSTTGTTPGTATLTATVTPATALPGSNATVTGTISAATGTIITGTVTATITNNTGTAIGTPTVFTLPGTAVSGTSFSFLLPVPATPGTYTVTIACASTAFTCTPVTTTLTSSSTATSLISTTTVLTAATSTTTTGATILTATVVAGPTGTALPTGTVIFYDGTTPIAVSTLSTGTAPATATATVTLSTTATHSLTAVYSGDAVYAPSTSAAITGITTASTTATISLTASTTTAIAGQNIVLTAVVSGLTAKSVGPTGTVSFYATGTTPQLLGTVTLGTSANGVSIAVLSTTGLPSGTQTIYAVYNGDTNFTTVTSNSITIGLSDFSLVFTPPTITMNRGQTAISTATVSITGGFTGSIALGCTPPPDSLITCSFSPAVLTGAGTSTLSVTTVAPKTAQVQQPGIFGKVVGGVSLAALVCLLIPGRGRRRIPALLILLFGLALTANLGCGDNNFTSPISGANGSPLGTSILTISTAGSNGASTVKHIYSFQVTIQ